MNDELVNKICNKTKLKKYVVKKVLDALAEMSDKKIEANQNFNN